MTLQEANTAHNSALERVKDCEKALGVAEWASRPTITLEKKVIAAHKAEYRLLLRLFKSPLRRELEEHDGYFCDAFGEIEQAIRYD